MNSTASASGRVVAVGLDGASFELLNSWLRSGDMPVLAKFLERGTSGGLESVIPPLTPPAWTSALTGVGPGTHGIINFLRPRFDRPAPEFFGANDWKAPALWDYLGAVGLRTIALHLPATYPPPSIDGLLVSGLPVTSLDAGCTWPVELKDELRQAVPGYRLFPDTMLLRTDRDAYYRDAVETLRVQCDETLYLMDRKPWSLLFTLWHMGDSLKHYFWDDMTRKSGNEQRRHYIRDYYREVDRALGRVLEHVGTDDHVILLSDHGHQGISRAIHLNAWLAKRGSLKVRIPPSMVTSKLWRKLTRKLRRKFGWPKAADGDNDQAFAAAARALEKMGQAVVWEETVAFAEPPGFIWLNLKGRNARGIVEPGEEYEFIRSELRDELQSMRDPDSGRPAFDAVYTREEAFQGPAIGDAPDLVAMPASGYITEYGVQARHVIGPPRQVGFNGYHVMRGMVALAGPDVKPGATLEGARIIDIAPTILHLLGLPAQPSMEGKVLAEALDPAALEARPIRLEPIDVPERLARESTDDPDAIARSLRDLGYM